MTKFGINTIIGIRIKEEVASMLVGPSLVTRKKRGANRPKSPTKKKRALDPHNEWQ